MSIDLKQGTGLRTQKTVLSVFICVLLITFINWLQIFEVVINPAMACISAVLTMQDSVKGTRAFGKNRFIGTAIGCLLALLMTPLILLYTGPLYISIIYGAGIFFTIWVCNIFNFKLASSAAAIAFVLTFNFMAQPLAYGIARTIQTFFGVTVAIIINTYIKPPKKN